MPRTNFTDLGELSAIDVEFAKPSCTLCPLGTYKLLPGDDFSLCLPCDLTDSVSAPDRMTCACVTVYLHPYTGFFNVLTGKCEKVRLDFIPTVPHDPWSTNTSVTRYFEKVCEPGHFCVHGRRYKCPAGNYGNLYQESDPQCRGSCYAGYYCLHGSISPQSRPCGGAKYICPVGSVAPVLVPPGYYTNENVDESFRYEQYMCPVGFFCPGDGKRYECPPGTFTDEEGTISNNCKGVCDRGKHHQVFNCLMNSFVPIVICYCCQVIIVCLVHRHVRNLYVAMLVYFVLGAVLNQRPCMKDFTQFILVQMLGNRVFLTRIMLRIVWNYLVNQGITALAGLSIHVHQVCV